MATQNLTKTKRLVACRECQRLKLKCNRSWPCDACVKRGVADICPEGALPTNKRQRSNLIDTFRLHEKNLQMSARIRQLEAALATVQSNTSNEAHPLLSDDLLDQATPLELPPILEGIKPSTKSPVTTVEETIEAFGTLSIEANGRTVFHSQAASADYLVEPPSSWTIATRDRSIAEAMSLSPEIIGLGTLFPFGDADIPLENLKQQILSFLPPPEKVCHLTENYFDYFSWLLDPIPREQFEHDIMPLLSEPSEKVSADRLSVLFMILAIGTILEVHGPLDLTSADSYWQLSRATFCLEPLLDVSTTFTIQALQLMAAYHHITNRQKVEHQWVTLGLVARLVHSSGLHVDGEHWIKDTQTLERRRKIFYEALSYDALMSISMGRPPAFALAHVHCKLPLDENKFLNKSGVEECSFPIWKYRFTKECLYPVMDDAFGAKPPSYSTIIRLDRKLREFPVPSHLIYPSLAGPTEELNPDDVPLRTWMHRIFLFCLKETSLLYLHRTFLAQALLDHPEDPFQSKYAASVLAAFRSASRIVTGVREISFRYMTVISRIWWIWQNLLSAGVVLATVVLRSPRCKLAQSALTELSRANELLQHRVLTCRSQHSTRVLANLLSRAEKCFSTGKPMPTSCGMALLSNDELALFTAAARTTIRDDQISTGIYVPQVESHPASTVSSWQDAHPDLMQFFNQLDSAAPLMDFPNGHDGLRAVPCALDTSMGITFDCSGSNEIHWQQIMNQVAS